MAYYGYDWTPSAMPTTYPPTMTASPTMTHLPTSLPTISPVPTTMSPTNYSSDHGKVQPFPHTVPTLTLALILTLALTST